MKIDVFLKNGSTFFTEVKEDKFTEFGINGLLTSQSGFVVTNDSAFRVDDVAYIKECK